MADEFFGSHSNKPVECFIIKKKIVGYKNRDEIVFPSKISL